MVKALTIPLLVSTLLFFGFFEVISRAKKNKKCLILTLIVISLSLFSNSSRHYGVLLLCCIFYLGLSISRFSGRHKISAYLLLIFIIIYCQIDVFKGRKDELSLKDSLIGMRRNKGLILLPQKEINRFGFFLQNNNTVSYDETSETISDELNKKLILFKYYNAPLYVYTKEKIVISDDIESSLTSYFSELNYYLYEVQYKKDIESPQKTNLINANVNFEFDLKPEVYEETVNNLIARGFTFFQNRPRLPRGYELIIPNSVHPDSNLQVEIIKDKNDEHTLRINSTNGCIILMVKTSIPPHSSVIVEYTIKGTPGTEYNILVFNRNPKETQYTLVYTLPSKKSSFYQERIRIPKSFFIAPVNYIGISIPNGTIVLSNLFLYTVNDD